MQVLVTGDCGFITYHAALHLYEKRLIVSVMDNVIRCGRVENTGMLERHDISVFHEDMRNSEYLGYFPCGIEVICDARELPSVVSGYLSLPIEPTHKGIGVGYFCNRARPQLLSFICWSFRCVYSADRLNAPHCRETPTHFEYDAGTWIHLPIEQHQTKFLSIHGVSEEYFSYGGQRAVYVTSPSSSQWPPTESTREPAACRWP